MPSLPGHQRSNGDWLAQHVGFKDFDLSSLGAAEPRLDSNVCGSVLSSLLQERPPSFAEAQEEAAACVARWEAPPSACRGSSGPPRRQRSSGSGGSGNACTGGCSLPSGGTGGPRSRSASRAADVPSPVGSASGGTRPPLPRPLQAAGAAALGSPAASPVSSPQENTWWEREMPSRRGGGDDSLVASMASRLAKVEQLNQQLTSKMTRQTQEIDDLRAQLAAVDQSQDQDGGALRAECEHLRQQVKEMRQLLAEYGLTWVPRQNAGKPSASPMAAESAVRASERLSRPPAGSAASGLAVDIKVIESRVEALNAQFEQERPQVVVHRAGGVRGQLARDAAALPLTFFRDGIKLADRAFLLLQSHPAQDLIRDLLDGYYPRALKDDYPDGVELKSIDRTGHTYQAWLKEFAHCDPDLTDGGERLRAAGQLQAPCDSRSSGERLLAKLPERVLRNGQVCQVRAAVADKLSIASAGSAGGAERRSTSEPPGRGLGKEVSILRPGRHAENPVAKLQVKLEGGQKVLLHMEFDATVGELWEALAAWRAKQCIARAGPACTLRTAFPPKSYTDMCQTLEAAGLTPSATLFVSEATEQHKN
eukprot:TRINITY_DN77621_c0_g1_i1.p1 TRINITY_DN77621_c0_g1~~TRINITY_DN77621_c0_g1_i1.p1  ORF type:complete len:593 (+),score=137.36 TRINITY_DN77621_c0_g1_i1:108-1886(+)